MRIDRTQSPIDDTSDEEVKIQLILATANAASASGLWMRRNWDAYSRACETLVRLIRSGRGKDVSLQNMQFLFFINGALRPYCSQDLPDRAIFMQADPRGAVSGQ